jgi:hypothetical protein
MRFLVLLSILCAGLSAQPPGLTDTFVPGAPPVTMRSFSSQPVVAAQVPGAPAQTRRALVVSSSVNMKLLVVDGNTSENSYVALTTFLGQIGVPYDVVVLSTLTPDVSGNLLDSLALTDPTTGHGNYQGILLTNSTFGGLLSTSDWATLDNYCTKFSVRMVSYYTSPAARWGLVAADSGANYLSANPLEATLTSAGASVFSYLNSANPIPIAGNAVSGIFAYQATPTAATGETTTSLLNVGSNTVGVTHTTATGEQMLALTFDNYPTLLHSLAFNYGVINWLTNGVFLGSRQIYLSNQIDDFLMGDRLYAPTLPDCPNDSTCPTMYVESGDLQALENWESSVRLSTQFPDFHSTFAYVGIGSTWYPSGDPLFAAISSLAPKFGWVSHTWDHPNLDCYTTTNGVCNPATLAQSLSELQQNIAVAPALGITIDPTGMVSPFNSGLSNPNFLAAAVQVGIQSIVYPGAGPTFNTGYIDSVNTAILEMPRLYTNLFDDVESPQTGVYGSWPDEYNAQYGPSGTTPTFSQNQTYSQILDNESDNVLLLDLLSNQTYLLGFHISDMWAYDGTHSLYSDLMDATITKYKAIFNLPVATVSMQDMRPLRQNRASYNSSGVTGGTPSTGTVTLSAPAPTGGISVALSSNNSSVTVPVSVSVTAGNATATFTVTTTAVTTSTTATITASYNGANMPASLTITPALALSAVSLNPTSVTGGTPSTGTVTLSAPAPTGGISVALNSNNSSATVPASVSVTAGNATATFTVTTTAVTTSTAATITASYNGGSKTASLTITPVITVSLTPSKTALSANQTQQFVANLAGSSNTAVIWSINPSVGSIGTSGWYAAPSNIGSQQNITVRATSIADPTVSASATVTLSPQSVYIMPPSVTLTAGQNASFQSAPALELCSTVTIRRRPRSPSTKLSS